LIRNLNLTEDAESVCDAQVCIIGAGTAGIFLAQQLRNLGMQVVMLEAGDNVARKPEEVDQRCEQRGIRYRGAEDGRSFGIGGTSVLWGGQMIPISKSDMGARPAVGFEAWPIDYAEVASYLPIVRQQLGLSDPADSTEEMNADLQQRKFPVLFQLSNDFNLRLSEWLPFKKRNFAMTFADRLNSDDGLTVWLNATVVDMVRSSSPTVSRIETITAQSLNGRKLLVRPSFVVISAGALESTRLLLEFDDASERSITRSGAPLGRYFADHLSVTCGRFVCSDWRRFNLAVSPIFEKGLMQTPRLELAGLAQQKKGLTSAFAHFTFVTLGDTGFDVVRNVLRRRQGEQQSLNFSPALLGRVVTDVSAMAFWRFVYQRLRIPRGADLLLQVDIEQTPNADSRLYLSGERDGLNRKMLVIDWQIKPEDIRVIRSVADLTIAAWQSSTLTDFADLELTLPDDFDSFATLHDVYHPTGSVRMGNSAASSVVDKDLRLWTVDNCYVTTTAVFPSAGSANPGMTHLALTVRLAEHLEKSLKTPSAKPA